LKPPTEDRRLNGGNATIPALANGFVIPFLSTLGNDFFESIRGPGFLTNIL
jgi:hypothetical protein